MLVLSNSYKFNDVFQHVNMTTNSNLLLLDWLTAGRMARGELWDFTRYFCSDQVLFIAFQPGLLL